MRIIALSLWERVAEGRVRAPRGRGRTFPAITRAFLPCRSQRAACTGYPHPDPLPEGEGVRRMRIIPLSLWERVAEGRVRAPNNPAFLPCRSQRSCLHRIPSPRPSPRGRGGKRDANHSPLPLGEGGRRPGEGTPNNPARSFPAVPNGAACTGYPHPNPLPEGEGVRRMRIIALSLWERVAEGRVRAPQ